MKRLSESIWSNINKRSEGNIERKEDDVDLMDGENFAIYLNKRYSFKNGHKIEYDKKLRTLTIPGLYTEDEFFYDNVGVDYENDSMTLRYMWINDPALTVQVRAVLKKRYNLSSKESSYIFISPLNGGELTNKFVVNVLDYMADLDIDDINIRRTVNESIWSNINKRSEGSIKRKEDTLLDTLTIDEFYDYLCKIYVTNVKNYRVFNHNKRDINVIEIPLIEEGKTYMSMFLKYDSQGNIEYIHLSPEIKKDYGELLEMSGLFIEYGGSKKYSFDEDYDTITSRESSKLKYSECVDIIDKFLEIIPEIISGICEGPLVIKQQ